MIYNKITGYVLFAVGLLLIIGTLFYSYRIFTGSALAPVLFKPLVVQGDKTSTPSTIQEQLQQQMDTTIKEQLLKMLPADAIPKILNLMSWSVLAGILIFGGGQIAGLGIRMIL